MSSNHLNVSKSDFKCLLFYTTTTNFEKKNTPSKTNNNLNPPHTKKHPKKPQLTYKEEKDQISQSLGLN